MENEYKSIADVAAKFDIGSEDESVKVSFVYAMKVMEIRSIVDMMAAEINKAFSVYGRMPIDYKINSHLIEFITREDRNGDVSVVINFCHNFKVYCNPMFRVCFYVVRKRGTDAFNLLCKCLFMPNDYVGETCDNVKYEESRIAMLNHTVDNVRRLFDGEELDIYNGELVSPNRMLTFIKDYADKLLVCLNVNSINFLID